MITAILASLVLWPLYLALALTLDVLGLVLLLPLSALRAWRFRGSMAFAADGSPLSDNWRTMEDADVPRHITSWRGGWLTWLWGNEEDGVTGPGWWRERTLGGYSLGPPWYVRALSAYRWSALRNPSNNLRFVPLINPVIRPEAIRARVWSRTPRWPAWRLPRVYETILTWQGVYSGIRCHIAFRGAQYRFWLGWKLKPEDAQGIPPGDMRAPRCGWATQFKRIG